MFFVCLLVIILLISLQNMSFIMWNGIVATEETDYFNSLEFSVFITFIDINVIEHLPKYYIFHI